MKPRLNSLAWMPSIMPGGKLAPSLHWIMGVAASRLVRINGKMNEAKYREILDENLLHNAQDLRLEWRFTFQQDNNFKHTAKTMQEWLRDKSLNVFEWPSQSPDLNPINHVWRDVTIAVQQLSLSNHRAWEDLQIKIEYTPQLQVCQACSVLPKKAVITAKGASAKYSVKRLNTYVTVINCCCFFYKKTVFAYGVLCVD